MFILFIHQSNTLSLLESMMVLRPVRQVFRLFSLVLGFASHISTANQEVAIFFCQRIQKCNKKKKKIKQQLHKVTERK